MRSAFQATPGWFLPGLFGCVLLIAVLWAFVPGIDNYLVSDDWIFLHQVSRSQDLVTAIELLTFDTQWFVRPSQWIVTMLIYRLAGTQPYLYHVVSLMFHLVSTLLFAILTKQLVRRNSTFLDETVFVAITTILFVVNWRHHETVFWYSSINELLAAFFRLCSLLSVWQYLQTKRLFWIAAGLFAFLFALASKESAIIFPAEVILLLTYERITDPNFRRDLSSRYVIRGLAVTSPFLIVGTIWALPYLFTSVIDGLSVARSGLQLWVGEPFEVLSRFLIFFNGHFIGTRILSSSTTLLAMEFLGLILLVVYLFRVKRWLAMFALTWTFVATVPYVLMMPTTAVSLFIPVIEMGVGGDRFLYYSALGASLALVAVVDSLLLLAGSRIKTLPRPMLTGVLALFFGLLILFNAQRLHEFERQWATAGEMARHILVSASGILMAQNPSTFVCLSDIPDNFLGRYVYRNGFDSALKLEYGIDTTMMAAVIQPADAYHPDIKPAAGRCMETYRYDEQSRQFVPLLTQ